MTMRVLRIGEGDLPSHFFMDIDDEGPEEIGRHLKRLPR